jgi:hypothetical protein
MGRESPPASFIQNGEKRACEFPGRPLPQEFEKSQKPSRPAPSSGKLM